MIFWFNITWLTDTCQVKERKACPFKFKWLVSCFCICFIACFGFFPKDKVRRQSWTVMTWTDSWWCFNWAQTFLFSEQTALKRTKLAESLELAFPWVWAGSQRSLSALYFNTWWQMAATLQAMMMCYVLSCSSQSRGGRLLKYSWFSAAWADSRFFGKHWRNLEANSSAWST